MKNVLRQGRWTGVSGVAAAALLLVVVALGAGCEAATEAKNNFDSRGVCNDYCAKKFSCEKQDPSSGQTDACVGGCRTSIENNCGNENQSAANDRIGECVDKGCGEFGACMVFEAAPSCFGFVGK